MKNLFVSSTFIDMQQERDALRDYVAPELNRIARDVGEYISFADLRWGIDTSHMTEEESRQHILDSCLDQIQSSDAPMILLLGDRYGWMPGSDQIQEQASAKSWTPEDLNISVTEMEMLYGTMVQKMPFFVYERKVIGADAAFAGSENEEARQKLQALKDKLRQFSPESYREYEVYPERLGDGRMVIPEEDLENFSKLVVRDLIQFYSSQWEATREKDRDQRTYDICMNALREKAMEFRGRMEEARVILDLLHGSDNNGVVIRGLSGSGKSTLAAYLAMQMEQEDVMIIPYVCGLLDQEYTEEEYADYLNQMLDSNPWRRYLVLIDGWDRLPAVQNGKGAQLSSNNPKLKFLVMGSPEIKGCIHQTVDYYLGKMDSQDRSNVSDGILAARRKSLSPAVRQYLMDLPEELTPLSLSLMIDRLCMMSGEDYQAIEKRKSDVERENSSVDAGQIIGEYQIQLLESGNSDIGSLSLNVFRAAARTFQVHLLEDCVRWIALSRTGLRMMDLAGLCGTRWNSGAFHIFVHSLRNQFVLRQDGRYDLAHESVKEGILRCIDQEGQKDSDESKENRYEDVSVREHRKIAEYLLQLDPNDELRQKELLVHLAAAKMKQQTIDYIIFSYRSEDILEDRERCRNLGGEAIAYTLLHGYDEWWLEEVLGGLKNREEAICVLYYFRFLVLDRLPKRTQAMWIQLYLVERMQEILENYRDSFGEQAIRTLEPFFKKEVVDLSHDLRIDRKREKAVKDYLRQKMQDERWSHPQSDEDRLWKFRVCYQYVFVLKSSSDKKVLQETLLFVENEARPMMTEEFMEYAAMNRGRPGEFLGCVGEIHGWLNSYELQLKNYKEDLRWRQYTYEHVSSDEGYGPKNLSGGYYNVGFALWRTHAPEEEIWEYYKRWLELNDELYETHVKAGTLEVWEESEKQHLPSLINVSTLFYWYNRQDTLVIPGMHEKLLEYAVRYLYLSLSLVRNLQTDDTIQCLKRYVYLLGNEIKTSWNSLYDVEGKYVLGNYSIRKTTKQELKMLRLEEENLRKEINDSTADTYVLNGLRQCLKELEKMEKIYGRYIDRLIDSDTYGAWQQENFRQDVRKKSGIQKAIDDGMLTSWENLSERQRKNVRQLVEKSDKQQAVKTSHRLKAEDKILAVKDMSMLKNAGKGYVFTNDTLYSTYLKHPVRYKDLLLATMYEKKMKLTILQDGERVILNLPGDKMLCNVLEEMRRMMGKK